MPTSFLRWLKSSFFRDGVQVSSIDSSDSIDSIDSIWDTSEKSSVFDTQTNFAVFHRKENNN
jgi:hypothetical protein